MKRIVIVAIVSAIAGALIALAIVHRGKEEPAGEGAGAPQRVSFENGEPTVTLDEETLKKIGIATTTLGAVTTNEELQAFGDVVDVKDLADFANQYAAARAQQQQAAAKAAFDERELQRLSALNADNKNVSDRAVQEAAAAVAADSGQAAAAAASIQGARAAAVQRFGAAVVDNESLLLDLVAMRKVLIELALPAGVAPPPAAAISDVRATLLAPAPRVDPRLQGRTFFYLAPGGKLSAGMNVEARIPTSRGMARVVVPPEAVVSWQGRSWIYVRRAPTKFARIDAAAHAGDEVVTTGAQQLLSEEMRSQLHEE